MITFFHFITFTIDINAMLTVKINDIGTLAKIRICIVLIICQMTTKCQDCHQNGYKIFSIKSNFARFYLNELKVSS